MCALSGGTRGHEALHVTARSKLDLLPCGIRHGVDCGERAFAQLVIDYPCDRHWTQRSGRQGPLNNSLVFSNMKRTLLILALVLTLGSIAGSSAYAQNGKVGPMAKLTPNLVNLHAQHTFHLAQRGAAQFISGDPLITSFNDRVLVDAVASGDVNVLKSDLVSLGMQQAVPLAASSQASCL